MTTELVTQFAAGDGVVFVGAGLSMGGGSKSWADLMAPLREEIRKDRPDLAKDLDALSLIDVAELYETAFRRRRLVDAIRAQLSSFNASWTPVHTALLQLPVREMFTTNFDKFIELAAQHSRKPCRPIIRNEDAAADGELRLYKIHGDYDDGEGVIITSQDYARVGEAKRLLFDVLRVAAATKTLLFMGYSFNDPDLNAVMVRIRDELQKNQRNAFAIQFYGPGWRGPELTAEDVLRGGERLERLGVRPVPVLVLNGQTPNEALEKWLNDFAAAVAKRRPQGAEAARAATHNLPPRPDRLHGRDEDVDRVFSAVHEPLTLAVQGPTGVGKTTLALEVAHRCADAGDRFKHVVWISVREQLRGMLLLRAVIDEVERTTGYDFGPPSGRPDEIGEARIGRFLGFLDNVSTLIVVDGLEPPQRTVGAPASDLETFLRRLHGQTSILVTTTARWLPRQALLQGVSGPSALDVIRGLLRANGWAGWIHPLAYCCDDELLALAEALHGNPQLLKLAFHLIKTHEDVPALLQAFRGRSEAELSELIHETAWARLRPESRDMIMATPLFLAGSIPAHALCAAVDAELGPSPCDAALAACAELGLLELASAPDEPRRYRVHSTTREFARAKLSQRDAPTLQKRLSDYYLDLVHGAVARRRPPVRYWNALVSEGMQALDAEWPNIRPFVAWNAHQPDKSDFLAFVMLLVHYLDSRMHHEDRRMFVLLAADELQRRGDLEGAALLHMDALGWTYLEDGRLSDAAREIRTGQELAAGVEGPAKSDLEALGLAWEARLRIEERKAGLGRRTIAKALAIPCSPWIRMRVEMAAGDIALAGFDGAKALQHYEAMALQPLLHYGAEGDGYQYLPRIGLARLMVQQASDRRPVDRQAFRRLGDAAGIPTSRLYAEYGMALANLMDGGRAAVHIRIRDIQKEFAQRSPRTLLLRAYDAFYDRLQAPETAAGPAPQPVRRRRPPPDALETAAPI